ncbi:protein kinase family protein [Streptomyces hainanensis]|uniref:Serine/threonine protein kinase n=1 Tax=Streptomyces hainanensis TaxID=402648 RepID=A0A4R4SL46_9ACTN|nr:protein kinase family protein [Streptomyces hainanensis]TDC64368.1 serine/threonine protein kinase [Streptomyces hainanensis]
MAERSTATSPPHRPASTEQASDAKQAEKQTDTTTIALTAGSSGDPAATADQASKERADRPRPAELHSGHRLAKRYRFEECITRLDGFSSWRAVDEKLRRAVGVHVLPAGHERAPQVLAAARSAALLGDPKFVQVLDAVEDNDLVHVIHEWLPDATPLSTVLATGPLDPHEASALAAQVAQAMAAAHRKDLAHLRLTPATVLRTGPSQFRIRGLAVDAALRGITSEAPKRTDTEAVGALLYAALTQRWPYADGAYGLSGVAGLSKGSRDSLVTPDQLRAGVHRGLSEIAMRALVNEGATAASQKPPFTTADEISRALAELPRIRPPEDTPTHIAGFQRTTYQRGTLANGDRTLPPTATRAPAPPAPALPGRTGTALKWGVSALLIAALGLGSWQLADALLKGDNPPENEQPTPPPVQGEDDAPASGPVTVDQVVEFNPGPGGNSQNPEMVGNVIDGDPESVWHTKNYYGPGFGNIKDGLGLILDLGEPQSVNSVTVDAFGDTPIEFRAAGPDVTDMPTTLDDFTVIAEDTGEDVTLTAEEPIETQFVLVWLTDLPLGDDGNYRGRIAEITVSN